MKALSLRLEDAIYEKVEKLIKAEKTNRNRFLNDAISFYAQYMERKLMEEKMKRSSMAVREQSMEVLKDYEPIDFESL